MIPTPDEQNFIKRWSKKAAEVFDHMGYTWGNTDPVTAEMIEENILCTLKTIDGFTVGGESGRIDVSLASKGSIEIEAGRRFKLRLNIDPSPYSAFIVDEQLSEDKK